MMGLLVIGAVVSILQAIGIVNPPSWFVNALLVATTVAAIISIAVSFGATIPVWAANAILAASTFAQ